MKKLLILSFVFVLSVTCSLAQKPVTADPVSFARKLTALDSLTQKPVAIDSASVARKGVATDPASASTITVDSVFAKYFAATGGKSLWDGIDNYSLKRTYNSNSAAEYESEIYVSIPQRAMSKSKVIMKRSFLYGIKGADGWLKIPIGGTDKTTKYQVKDLSLAEQEIMRMEMYDFLAPFIDYKNRNFVATLVGTEKLEGEEVYHVETQAKGLKYNLYFDTKSGLLVREKKTMGGEVTVTDFSNYVKSAYGILYPSMLVQTNNKDNSKVTIKSELAVNGTINPDYFKR